MTQKRKIISSLVILVLILFLFIFIVYLIPVKKDVSEVVIRDDSGNEEMTDMRDDSGKEILDDRDEEKKGGVPPVNEEQEVKGGKIAIVIDDAGNSLKDLLPFLQFPGKLSIAVLPQLEYSIESSHLIAESGKEVLLHQPMEPENGMDPGPGALYSTFEEEEMIKILMENLQTVPDARGANNHMGSKLTSNPEKMNIVLRFFYEHGLYFLDSRTTGSSVCRETAAHSGIPLLERHIFLDNVVDKAVIREQMEKGIALAGKNRYVIIVGHVQNSEVLDVLYEFLPEMEQKRYAFVGLSEIYGK